MNIGVRGSVGALLVVFVAGWSGSQASGADATATPVAGSPATVAVQVSTNALAPVVTPPAVTPTNAVPHPPAAATNRVVIPPPPPPGIEPVPPRVVPHTPRETLEEAATVSPRWLERQPREELPAPWQLASRLELGTRLTAGTLTDTSRPMDNRFLGSINKLKDDQDLSPYKVFANYWLLDWIGVGVSYEKLAAKTWSEGEEQGVLIPYTDGTFEADGPILSLLAAYPNRTRLTPFAELGYLFFTGSFDAAPEWGNAHGIEGYQDFAIVQENGGFVWGLGCAAQLWRNWEVDILFRQITASVVVNHVIGSDTRPNDYEFPLDSNWFGFGVKYRL